MKEFTFEMAVKQNNTEGGNASSSLGQASKINNQKTCDLSVIISTFDPILSKQRTGEFRRDKVLHICDRFIHILSKEVVAPQSDDIKRFQEDILKVGEFLAKVGEEDPHTIYLRYLKIVCTLITHEESPSCAIAIVFQLFPDNFIKKAVSLFLSTNDNVSDEAIKKTINTLCGWLRICTFCQKLNIWIIAILNGLQELQKYDLLYSISMDVIEPLFIALIIPAFRPNIAPVVFHILSSIKHTPDVFNKIIGRAPKVINQLKKEGSGEECKKTLQNIVDMLSALMIQFPSYDDSYKQTEEALSDFTPSFDYRSVLSYPGWCPPDNAISSNAKVGLVNLGNTCYMNSVLQALAMTKEFSREILLSPSKSPILSKIQQLFALMLHSSRPELTPSTVLHATRPPGFLPGLQQDSSEFLGYLLEILNEQEANLPCRSHQCDSSFVEQSKTPSDITDYAEEGATSCNFKQNSFAHVAKCRNSNKTTTIEKTFEGKITTTYQCATCNWQSKNIDSFRDLQLSFPEVKIDCASNYSVQDLLDYYCSSEKLDGDNQYFCERCKKLTDAERFINIVSAPKNLILTLKHFKYDQKFHMRAKLMHKVFHDESVSLKVYSSETLNEVCTVNYNLYAAVVHSGYSMDSGHYYTYASDSSDNWYKFNDNIVTPCEISELHNLNPPNTPYILFYQMNSRTNENSATSSNSVVRVEVPSLEELPPHLREYVSKDNGSYKEETRLRNSSISDFEPLKNNKRGNGDHDDEPPSACGGGNTFNYVNRFIS